ncbi:MAG: peroxiredoxin-like family protein [Thermoanaerobaculia bacterium]|nr:peroxiredoxin-like family protein [Thermoanaerobaculia bacterium]
MRERIPELEAAGARPVLIGNGTPDQAKGYREDLGGAIELLVDPQLVGYKAMQLERSLLAAYNPKSFLQAFQLHRLGFRQGPTEGDALQLGGVFVIDPQHRVVWSYRARDPSDFPALDDLVAAARSC